jgi:hypothetical protein
MIQSSPVTGGAAYSSRRLNLRRHGLVLLIVALAAFVAGLATGAGGGSERERLAERYAAAWARGDHAAMHGLLTEEARRRTPLARFRALHRRAAVTATATGLRAGAAKPAEDDVVRVPIAVRTRAFGTVRSDVRLPIEGDGEEARIAWTRELAFPGVRRGEQLTRRTRLPTRASILAGDGTLIAGGPDRGSADPELAASIGGQTGPIPPERRSELRAEGVPADADIGLSGLERALDDQLRGTPGGVLRAGRRELAVTLPRPAEAVRSTIVPRVQRAAVAAIGPRVGGVVALDPRTGGVIAAAGIGFSGLQPPGSTFKIITLAGALEAGITEPATRYPVETATTIEGVRLENANGEACGGTLIATFAESCNSVFAPLGAKLGAEKLVEISERFGFNRPPGIAGAATSTIPAAGEIGDDLAVGSSAIGQGLVQASALQMALVARTIAGNGRRRSRRCAPGARPRLRRSIDPLIAQIVARGIAGRTA